MGFKRRNTEDNWMPKRVYKGKSAYEYRSPCGRAFRLCKLDANPEDVWFHYREILISSKTKNTVSKLIDEFINSPQFHKKAMTTQRDYRSCSNRIRKAFGQYHPDQIKIHHIRGFMDARGRESEVRANRELSFFTVTMAWGVERAKVKCNPCKGIKRYQEKSRDRYVDDNEYQVVYNLAIPNLQCAMEIAYLCAARQRDILDLTRDDIRKEGLYIEQGKTGKKQIKEWTPRLKAAIDLAISQPSSIDTNILIHTKSGCAYTSSGIKSIFKRTVDKALGIRRARSNETPDEITRRLDAFNKKYPKILQEPFTFHDLKAKGISDYLGDKMKFSGHKTYSQMQKYNRKVEVVKIVNPKEK